MRRWIYLYLLVILSACSVPSHAPHAATPVLLVPRYVPDLDPKIKQATTEAFLAMAADNPGKQPPLAYLYKIEGFMKADNQFYGEAALIWLPVRLALGWAWLEAGWEKLNNPAWMNGTAILGFWQGAIKNASGAHPSVGFDWYAGFLQTLVNMNASPWFGPLIAVAEFAAGLCLMLGLFTGIAALGAAVLNLNFMLAGSAGVNPIYFLLGILLVLAWRNAGWIGLDRWVLPGLGTPWQRGQVLQTHPPVVSTG